MTDSSAVKSLQDSTQEFLSSIEKEVREKDSKPSDRYSSSRDRDRHSRRSGREEPSDPERHSSSRRKRDTYDEGDDYDREKRKSRRDRDYDRRGRDEEESSRRRKRHDDEYYGADDYYSRSSRSRRDQDRDRDDGYSYRREKSRYDSYDDDRFGGRPRGGGGGGDWRNPDLRDGSPMRRSPTPEGTIPISQRLRPDSKWDIAAPGFEGSSAMAAKATGLFGIPGQSRTLGVPPPTIGMSAHPRSGAPGVVVPPSLPPIHLGGGGAPPHGMPGFHNNNDGSNHHNYKNGAGGGGGSGGGSGAGAGTGGGGPSRQSRRLYVGNITYDMEEAVIVSFFNKKMIDLNLGKSEGEPCVSAQLNPDKGYAFIEFRDPEEATLAMSFDGIVFQNQSLKVRRPKDYVGPDIRPPSTVHVPGVISTNVPDSSNKIFIGGLPTYLTDDQVIELLQAFGELRAFNLVKDPATNISKGFAFCEYVDPGLTDLACQGLNEMELGDRKLVVQRASVGSEKKPYPSTAGTGANAGPLGNAPAPNLSSLRNANLTSTESVDPTNCMTMLNMVTPEELDDDEEYADIVEDIREECMKYGTVTDVRIPRPGKGSKGAAAHSWKRNQESGNADEPKERDGVGRVYVRYDKVDECANALRAIAGRQFGGRLVICAFLKEEDWPSDEDGGQDAQTTAAQANGPAYGSDEPDSMARGNDQQQVQGQEQEDDDGGEAEMAMGDDDD